MPAIYYAHYPKRKLAIEILETLENLLDAEWEGGQWFQLEDAITHILMKKEKEGEKTT